MSAHDSAMSMDREAEKAQFLMNGFWCYSCLCTGQGLAGLSPMVSSKQKCLCIRIEETSGEECCGPLGCISGLNKMLCCIQMSEFPPDPLMIGCCNKFCIGAPPTGPGKGVSAEQFEQMQFVANTFWCWYCCCSGSGFGGVGDPLIKGQSKMLCCRQNCETDDICGTEGTTESCCYSYRKCLCLLDYFQCLPALGNTPGIGCCGVMCAMQKFADAREPIIGAPAQQTELADRDV